MSAAQVRQDQRHTRARPCAVCGGHGGMRQGNGRRCAGFRSSDGAYEHCQREQLAGCLELNEQTTPPTYAHKLRGECRCGVTHGPGTAVWQTTRQARGPKPIETRYELRDESGELVGVHARRDFLDANGRPYRDKRMWWEGHAGRAARQMPLYRLQAHLMAAASAVRIVCEGEKAAEALNGAIEAGRCSGTVMALGTVTGAPAIPCDESLRVLLGCPVALWPDNDEVGRRQMKGIAERLVAMGGLEPKWVQWADAPPKGDAADYFKAGWSVEDMLEMVTEQRSSANAEGGSSAEDPLSGEGGEWDGGALLSDVVPVRIEWLWEGYIPFGKLTMGDGDPGLGKTLLYAADLAARVTTGRPMPDGTPGIQGGAGVVIFTAEDDPADTLRPRLAAAGGDLKKALVVTTVRRPAPGSGDIEERLPTYADLTLIERAIERVEAKLVIFDPFMAYLPSAVNSFRDQDVRSVLAPLARLAQRTGAAFVLIRHLNKGNFANALYRGGGSIGIIGAARAGLLVVKDPDDENVRIFGGTKSNLGKPMPSWRYRIVANEDGVPTIEWVGQSERSASELLNVSGERDAGSKFEMACAILREALEEGPRPEKAIEAVAKEQGISRGTLRRAKDVLGVRSEKVGIGRDSCWEWSLPVFAKGAQEMSKGAHITEDEHLWTKAGYKPAQQADSPKGAQVDGYEHLCDGDEGEAGQWTL